MYFLLGSKIIPATLFFFTLTQLVTHYHFLRIIVGSVSITLTVLCVSWLLSGAIIDFWKPTKTKIRSCPSTKCVLITGCDTGFGHVTALHLNKVGFTVFAGCLNPEGEGGISLQQNCKDLDRMHVIRFDVTSDADIQQVYERIESHTKKTGEELKCLINNAGIACWSAAEWGSMEQDIQPVISVNLTAVMKITRSFLPMLRKNKDSRIIFVTSQITRIAVPFLATYTMSKRGVKAFADALRAEVDMDSESYNGMKIVNIEPSAYKTGITEYENAMRSIQKTWDRTSRNVQQSYGTEIRDGFVNFFSICRYFQFFDFVAMRKDLIEISKVMEETIRIQDPETDYHLMPFWSSWLSQVTYTILPDEWLETMFMFEVPGIKLFSLNGYRLFK